MCGIIYTDKTELFRLVGSLTDTLYHRGPDFQSHVTSPKSCFGHTRLAFQDLSSRGNQPYVSECNNYCLVFNGEIYNFNELRNELEKKNIVFNTRSDTEVLFRGLIEYGINFICRLDGMFSFIFENKRENSVYLARDQHGMKPLFYQQDSKGILAGSEFKIFNKKKTSINANIDYLIFGYIPEPATWYDNIYCVPTHQILKYDLQKRSITFIPWEAKQNIRYSLEASVQQSLTSDVQVATFFSGGLDSSLISYYASGFDNQNYCFGLGFQGFRMDESEKQERVSSALQFNSDTIYLSDDEVGESLTQFLSSLEYPTNDGFNTFLLCKKAKELGFKACLSGLGADELFGGYPSFFDYQTFKIWEFGRHIPESLLRTNAKISRLAWLKKSKLLGKYLARRSLFGPGEVLDILGIPEKLLMERVEHHEAFVSSLCDTPLPSFMEQKYYMRGQLLRDSDFFSMFHSVELRMPFLNIGITNWSLESQKAIYKQKFPKQELIRGQPELFGSLFQKIKKQGFILPFEDWLFKFMNPPTLKLQNELSPAQKWSLIILDSV